MAREDRAGCGAPIGSIHWYAWWTLYRSRPVSSAIEIVESLEVVTSGAVAVGPSL